MPLTPQAVVARLSGSTDPIIMLDACTVLDIVRAPVRDNIDHIAVNAARSILREATNGTVTLVVANVVKGEIDEHLPVVTAEAESHIKRAAASYDLARRCAAALDGKMAGRTDLAHLHISSRLGTLVTDLLALCVELAPEDDHKVRAMNRVLLFQRPARRGKMETKDCLFIEQYMALAELLRTAGCEGVFQFASSNVSDFSAETSNAIHPDLAPAFARSSIDYSLNLPMAARGLGLKF